MGRRIFEERKYNVDNHVLSFEDFRPFIDLIDGIRYNDEQKERLIKLAEGSLAREIPQPLAHQYMMYSRNGNRNIFEDHYHPRRVMALNLAIGEYIEKKGRFTDKLIDVVWLILEETTWVISAHNRPKEACLPVKFKDDIDYIDLFSAWTGAALSIVYYLCKDVLDDVTTIICDRILFELQRRIIKPFMSDVDLFDKMWWSGVKGNRVNNWCPWIVSNVLTVTALTVKDTTLRTNIVRRSIPMLDAFTSTYHPDGGCDEGPGYWNVAGGALFGACLLLYDMTDGYINVFDDPLLKNMGEYAVKAVVTSKRVLNFADANSTRSPSPTLLYLWGDFVKSDLMTGYASWISDGELLPINNLDMRQPYRGLRLYKFSRLPKAEFKPAKTFYIGGIEVSATRECDVFEKGLYVALKGGHNAESHNHNDIGNVIVFADDMPIFIDAGAGGYTKKTFSAERYIIWAMNSDHHNCATVNGLSQGTGKQFASKNSIYDPQSGKFSIDITNAYPLEAQLSSYIRSTEIINSEVLIKDRIEFSQEGSIIFNYLVRVKPEKIDADSFMIEGRRVSFDDRLEFSIEALDNQEPEVMGIPKAWECESLYRIRLSSKEKFQKAEFVLKVK